MANAWGMPSHFTDPWLNWRIKRKDIQAIRDKADMILAGKGSIAMFFDLLSEISEQVRLDEADDNAGAEL